jgi:hypothetical protein
MFGGFQKAIKNIGSVRFVEFGFGFDRVENRGEYVEMSAEYSP